MHLRFKNICLLSLAPSLIILLLISSCEAQTFFRGADLSYVNEMEDCGVVYKENGQTKDVYDIFADNGCNMARFRLWHSPTWYDALNDGKRYADTPDVIKAMKRAKSHQMNILLDFHLSDNWADPSNQRVPSAWLSVVNDLPALKDSLYQYIYTTLSKMHMENILPEMVQIGNETNRGILLSPEDNAQWTLDWSRNAVLFNTAISAVRKVEEESGKSIDIALHLAGPSEVNWLLNGFLSHGVVDFDVIGISYYWAWHKPTTIAQTGALVKELKTKNPNKKVIIFETGYIWTNQSNDQAPNIISEVHPNYSPASPDSQYRWLRDLTAEVIKNNGDGVLYWEPAWVSSSCFTQWGKGSHQEHATFFDFSNNLLKESGIKWMKDGLTTSNYAEKIDHSIVFRQDNRFLYINYPEMRDTFQIAIFNSSGQIVYHNDNQVNPAISIDISALNTGIYFLTMANEKKVSGSYKFFIK